jgi:hypothetical protein
LITEERLNIIGQSVLAKAENLFGKREPHKFHGFKFWNNNNSPQLIGEPITGYFIFISDFAKKTESEANFQIAHEVVHLLSPTSLINVSTLEEGLATCFSIEHLKEIGFEQIALINTTHLEINYNKYYSALEMVRQVNDLFLTAKLLRDKFFYKKLSDLGRDDLLEFIPSLEIVERLSKKFN